MVVDRILNGMVIYLHILVLSRLDTDRDDLNSQLHMHMMSVCIAREEGRVVMAMQRVVKEVSQEDDDRSKRKLQGG